ncbi:unnamed protein product, partial [Sphacelaria rigidula]
GRGAEGSEGTDATFLKKKVFDNSMRRSSSSLTEDAETPKGTVPVKVFQWPSSPSSAAQKQDKNMDTQRTDTFGKTEIVVNSVPLEGAGNNYASRGDGVPTITRNPSAADSVVDGWNPNALRRLSSKYDTDNEDSTLRQSRPASRRGQIPCFSDLPEGDEATNDASGGNMRLSVPPTTFNTASYNSAGVGAALSPIHSVRSSVVDLSQPISLDALRDTGMFSLTPSSGAGGKHARKRSHTRRPSIVPVDHENDSDSIASDCQAVSEDGSSSSSCPSPSSSDDDADDERDMSRASSESTTDGGNKRDAAPAVVDTSGDDRSISVASEAAVPAPMMVMGPNGFASPSIQAPPAPSQQAPPLADPKSAKSKGDPSSCPVNDPFFFNGPDGNKTSVFGSPAPSDRLSGVGAGIGNPEIVVGDANSRMFGSNPISATDANNSSLWAAAAAAAHRRNATTISLSSELRNMDSASRMDPETETPSVLRQALRVLGLVKSASRVMPGPGPNAPEHVGPTPPAPDSSAIPNSFRSGSIPPTPVKPANIVDEGGLAGILSSSGKVIMDAPVSGDGGVGVIPPLVKPDGQGHGVLGKTPMISPSGSSCSDTDSETSDSSEEVAAQARAEVEGDVEEG